MTTRATEDDTLTAGQLDAPTTRATGRFAVLSGPKQIDIRELPLPEPGPQEVRIKLEGSGVCHSNLPVWEGREWFQYPLEPGNPGHEGWGRIDAIGARVKDYKVGDRVAAVSYKAYAEYDLAAANALVKLPRALDGKPFPGEPLGCAMNIFRRSDIKPGQTVAIIGIGFLGALLVARAKEAGARVIAISRRRFALELAERYGADERIVMDDHWQIIEQVKRLTWDKLCDRVIECVGLQWPLDLAAELCGTRGKLIIAGYHQDGPRQANVQLWNWKGLDVINAHERDVAVYVRGIEEAVDRIANGRLDPAPLYKTFDGLEQLNTAFETLSARPDGFVKAVVRYA